MNGHPATADPIAATAAPGADPRVPTDHRAAATESNANANDLPLEAASQPASHAGDQPVVSDAHMAESVGQTEIRIEMQAGPLGAVELRAHIAGDQIGASIAVEHHEAQMMLASDLPALHSALAGKNLNVNTLHVSQGMATSTGMGHGGGAGQHRTPSLIQKFQVEAQPDFAASAASIASIDLGQAGVRLSVLA